jgi:hypothetical protein
VSRSDNGTKPMTCLSPWDFAPKRVPPSLRDETFVPADRGLKSTATFRDRYAVAQRLGINQNAIAFRPTFVCAPLPTMKKQDRLKNLPPAARVASVRIHRSSGGLTVVTRYVQKP